MNTTRLRPVRARFLAVLAVLAALTGAAPAADTRAARLYEITTETGMPHLEENLRYATTHGRQCIAPESLAGTFPILSHPALRGCELTEESHRIDGVSYRLVCSGGHGTTGKATWWWDDHRIRGELSVKLGGKNMTFYQRITAVSLGDCPPAPP